MKRYKTGKYNWDFGQINRTMQGDFMHKLLGPCPKCGCPTSTLAIVWECNSLECTRGGKSNLDWWNTDINVFLDGKSWCATRDGFINLQESIAGFGKTPGDAVADLIKSEKG